MLDQRSHFQDVLRTGSRPAFICLPILAMKAPNESWLRAGPKPIARTPSRSPDPARRHAWVIREGLHKHRYIGCPKLATLGLSSRGTPARQLGAVSKGRRSLV